MIGWLDLGCGVAGDMLLAALADLGAVDPAAVPAALGLDATVDVTRVQRAGLAAVAVTVTPGADQPGRRLPDLLALVDAAALPGPVRAAAARVLTSLADAEAVVHGTGRDEVHFHEVGAVDSLVDVVGACWGLHALGLTALHAGPLSLGGGTVAAAHGRLPVPVPAVLALLAGRGVPVVGGPVDRELATPTGVAVLLAHVTTWGPLPTLQVHSTGTGAGSRDLDDRPNVLRLVLGATAGGPEEMLLLETNVDDLDPRLWPRVIDRLLAAGAADAWLSPVLMKKGRPAHTLHVLVAHPRAAAAREVVFAETTTLGLREQTVARTVLDRELVTVTVDGHEVAVKLGSRDGGLRTVQPEWEDVLAVAEATGTPAKDVLARAAAAAREQLNGR